MSGDRFAYYFKTILNSSLEDIQEIAYQFENDRNISIGEAQELERMLEKHQEMFKPPDVYVINASTGNEEMPPKSEIDNFGNSSVYVGSERAFGVDWKIYSPSPGFINSPVKKWYYNRQISELLNGILVDVVPGKLSNYFDYPPWVLGTKYAPNSKYVPLKELVLKAIYKGYIDDFEQLYYFGIPKELINVIRSQNSSETF